MRYLLLFLTSIGLLMSCGTDNHTPDTSESTVAPTSNTTISEERPSPKSTPVANYVKRVNNDLNEWYFRVQLYETKKRFVYRMVMEYETINEEKEITFPNLKEDPKPSIQPGKREYDAIVGFMDNKGQFKDFINVFVENESLRVRTLKYYAVTQKEAE